MRGDLIPGHEKWWMLDLLGVLLSQPSPAHVGLWGCQPFLPPALRSFCLGAKISSFPLGHCSLTMPGTTVLTVPSHQQTSWHNQCIVFITRKVLHMDEQNYSTIKMMVGDTMAFGIIKLILFHNSSWKKSPCQCQENWGPKPVFPVMNLCTFNLTFLLYIKTNPANNNPCFKYQLHALIPEHRQ